MTKVYLLWHIHAVCGGEDDQKLIGVYSTWSNAEAAIELLRAEPGFKDFPDGWKIFEYTVDKTGWTKGLISAKEALETPE